MPIKYISIRTFEVGNFNWKNFNKILDSNFIFNNLLNTITADFNELYKQTE
jgi:hypothetical protein